MKAIINIFILLLFIMSALTGAAQIPGIAWEHCYGGSGNDITNGLLHLNDGTFILLGTTESNDGMTSCNHGGKDVWLAKLDSMGTLMWRKCFGGSSDDIASNIISCNDGGFLITGSTSSIDGNINGYHFFGDAGNKDCWLIKLDALCNIQWQHCYGGSRDDIAIQTVQLSSDDFIFTGSTNSSDGDVSFIHDSISDGATDIWIVKVDQSGNMIWNRSFGSNSNDFPTDLKIKSSNELYISGTTTGNDGDVQFNHGYFNIWWLSIDTSGNLLQQKCFGGSTYDGEGKMFVDSIETWILGSTQSSDGDVGINYGGIDCFIMKVNTLGGILHSVLYGGSSDDIPNSIIRASDGSYYLTVNSRSLNGDFYMNHSGGGYSDIWIIKCDSNGNSIWQKNIGGYFDDNVTSFIEVESNNFVLGGTTSSLDGDISLPNGLSDMWIVKLSSTVGVNQINFKEYVNIFPNPSSGKFQLQINPLYKLDDQALFLLYDMQGKAIDKRIITDHFINYNNHELKSGLYLYKIVDTNQFPITGKILIVPDYH